MKPTPVINGLLLALSTCPYKPDAFKLNREAFAVICDEIHIIRDESVRSRDIELALPFAPVTIDGEEYPAIMGIPLIVMDDIAPVPASDLTRQPSVN